MEFEPVFLQDTQSTDILGICVSVLDLSPVLFVGQVRYVCDWSRGVQTWFLYF